jgi:hypothetical protein
LSISLRGLILVILVTFGLGLKKNSSSITLVVEDRANVYITVVIKEDRLCMRKMGVVDKLPDEYAIVAPLHSKPVFIVLRKETFIEVEMRSVLFFGT